MKDKMKEGLIEGVQVRLTPFVKKESGKIKGEGLGFIANILKYIKLNYRSPKKPSKKIPRRTRTVEELIRSKVLTGCTDHAHLFLGLCRARGVPALYVETFKKDWLKNPIGFIQGHIFARVNLGKDEIIVDPTRKMISFGGSYGQYKKMCEGIDFGSLFGSRDEYIKKINKHFRIKIK